MKINLNLYKLLSIALIAVCCWVMSACAMMETDLSDCPKGLYVSFVYDYNIQHAEIFKDHVGSVTLYVFDENNKFVMEKTEENNLLASYTPLKTYNYKMHLDLPQGKYRLVSLANQKSYQEILQGKGAVYRRTELEVGDDISKLQVKLDRTSSTSRATIANGSTPADVVQNGVQLDTLWHAINAQHKETSATKAAYDTLNLTRNNKNITVSLRQVEDQANIDDSMYDVFILDNNGTTNYDNSVAQDEDIKYSPHDTWTTEFVNTSGEVVQRAAHYGVNCNRLILYDTPEDNALLVVRKKDTQQNIVVINLPDCLGQGRNAVERQKYTPQEFLDREHNFKLDFILKGGTWLYLDLSISIESWSQRIQNINF